MGNLKKSFCILGYPGSGKGAQSEYIARSFGLFHIDIGERLRRITREDSSFAKDINFSVHRENTLVPDEVIRYVLRQVWNHDVRSGVIIDGAPRRLGQKAIVEEVARERGAEIVGVLFLSADLEKITERIRNRVSCPICNIWYIVGKDVSEKKLICPKCNGILKHREDDTPRGIKRRVAVFERETMPVIEAYRREKKLIEISANGSLQETQLLVDNALKPFF